MAQTLGQRVRSLRGVRGVTLAAVAARSGVSVSYLSDIEHDRTVPTLIRLHQIAEAFGLSARDLLKGVEPYDKPSSQGEST